MIGIKAIGTYLPAGRIDNLTRLDEFGIDKKFLEEKTGMLEVAIKSHDEETSDLCVQAYNNLCEFSEFNSSDVDCIIVCTQNPDSHGLPHTSAIVHEKLKLNDYCSAFDISLGCSGYVYGLSVIQSFMQCNEFRKGILFTADPYSKIIDPSDKNVSLLFGDGATATLLDDDAEWTAGKFLLGTRGSGHDAIQVRKEDRILEMNGRGVLSFSITMVPDNINEMLIKNNVHIEEVDCFVLHQGSRFIIKLLTEKLGVSGDKVLFCSKHYGNTVSSSIPMILKTLDKKYKKIVIAGFGVGLSWGSTILTRAIRE